MNKKTNKAGTKDSVVARDRRATGAGAIASSTEGASANEPVARRSTATTKRTRSEILREYWRDVKAGRRVRDEKPHTPPKAPDHNPLFDLPEEERAKLFAWLRDCPYMDAVRVMLRDKGLPEVTNMQIEEFHQEEAQHHWEMRTGRAAVEADALVRLVEKSGGNFSAGMLAALGQEAFRQIASGSADPGVMSRIGTLFMKARSDDRADQMQQLKRRKMERELGDDAESSLEQLADLVQDHPAAREALDALRRELAANPEGPA